MINLNEYITTDEAVKILGISRSTLYQWSKKSIFTIEKHPANGRALYKKNEIEALSKNRVV